MRLFALPLLALAALTGGALAQPKPATPAAPPPAAMAPAPDDDAGGPPPPPDAGPGSAQAGQPDAPPRPMPPDGPRGHRPPPPPPPKAAHFRLGHGDTMVDVKCAEDEPMKACADLALQLLDHLQQAPRN